MAVARMATYTNSLTTGLMLYKLDSDLELYRFKGTHTTLDLGGLSMSLSGLKNVNETYGGLLAKQDGEGGGPMNVGVRFGHRRSGSAFSPMVHLFAATVPSLDLRSNRMIAAYLPLPFRSVVQGGIWCLDRLGPDIETFRFAFWRLPSDLVVKERSDENGVAICDMMVIKFTFSRSILFIYVVGKLASSLPCCLSPHQIKFRRASRIQPPTTRVWPSEPQATERTPLSKSRLDIDTSCAEFAAFRSTV